MFQEAYMEINGMWVQRLIIGSINIFDQKIIVLEEPKDILLL